MYKSLIYLLLAGILTTSCAKDNIPPKSNGSNNQDDMGWLVPVDELLISQLPPDRIHSIDAPYFQSLDNFYLNENEPIYVYRYGDTVKIYTQKVLGGHEIVNDRIGDHYFAITYCPLTGSAIAWNREIDGEVTEFGVSGHLFKENLIPYDRNGLSYWSQMRLQGIKGNNGGSDLESGLLLSTTGATVRRSFPNAMILVDTSGQNCNDSICGGLKKGDDLGDPGDNIILPGGDYFGIVNIGVTNGGEAALLFNYDVFDDSIKVHYTNFKNSNIIVAGSRTLQFIVAFKDNTGDPNIKFFPVQNALPVILADNKGNSYDITGLIVSGPSKGNRLPSPKSYTAHSFAWDSFFGSNIELYQ